MKRYTVYAIVFICILITAFIAQATTVLVDPATQESPPAGETLTVGIKVEDVIDLYGYDILLIFDNTALKFIGIQEENFLKQDAIFTIPHLILGWEDQEEDREFVLFNDITLETAQQVNSAGGLLIVNTRTTDISGIDGTADMLVTITFEVLEAKASVLQLGNADYPVALLNSAVDPDTGWIDTDVVDGEITSPPHAPVINTPDGMMLALQTTYDGANVPGHTYIDIWKGSILVEAGMFLQFQVTMFPGNPTFQGSVDLHTSDGGNLRDSGAADQNDVSAHPSADLSEYARGKWYNRKISLDALAGKTIDGVMIATDSSEHAAGIFRVYVDNIQITNNERILEAIYINEETIPSTGTDTATETTFAGTDGMSDYSVTIVGATPVTPAGKVISSWGGIKSAL